MAVDAVEKQGGMEIIEEIQTDELYGSRSAPGQRRPPEAVNGALQELKDDGTVDELYEKYFSGPAGVGRQWRSEPIADEQLGSVALKRRT